VRQNEALYERLDAAQEELQRTQEQLEHANAEVERLTNENDAIRQKQSDYRTIVERTETLRSCEGDPVSIPNDNPDFGGPNTVVFCSWDYDDGHRQSYAGETLLECLVAAVQDREARETQESKERKQ